MSNEIKFNSDGKLRILQVSDPQDLKYVRPAMVKMLDCAYDKLNPDLVLFTGDNILGNHLLDARIGNRKVAGGREATLASMKEALKYVLEPVDRRNIPFAMIYGNHDDMNDVSKDEQAEIYRSYKCCMPMNTDNPDLDCDTYVIKCFDGEKPAFALFMLDSAWQDMDGKRECHEDITPETVEWYRRETLRMKEENGGENVPALMFIHIPLKEQMNFIKECDAKDRDAVKGDDGKYYRLSYEFAYGKMGEFPSVVKNDNGLFDAVTELGNVKAIITGHDHCNCFIGTYKDIDFIQTGCASFRCYGDHVTRGVRVIDLCKDGTYETKFYDFFELCGKGPVNSFEYFWNADELAVKKFTTLGIGALALTAAGVYGIVRAIRK